MRTPLYSCSVMEWQFFDSKTLSVEEHQEFGQEIKIPPPG